MYNKRAWIKELKSWIRNSKSYLRFAEKQIRFWQEMHKETTIQLALQEEWLKEAKEE